MGKRLDQLLVEKGLFPSREKAQAAIMAGTVWVNGKRAEKAGHATEETASIELKGDTCPYVSRGGLKLARALQSFGITMEGKVCADIGASTGGFTDCMLKNGAVQVYAVDVGYGQLDWSLRNDPRVVVMERTNARYLKPEQLETKPVFASIDVSFISLKIIVPAVVQLLEKPAEIVALIKPQFEAGKDRVGKKGVVRSPEVHLDVIKETIEMGRKMGLVCSGLTYSPIKGPEGNVEFLIYWRVGVAETDRFTEPEQVVAEAHLSLSPALH
ncbi:MAG TPA: TlyA family RNA methyltransferase [Bacillota bacterium]|nr:TlyA family RNA methyltransferase [Bacillota bacterium]